MLKLDVNGKPRELKFGSDMVVGTRTGKPRSRSTDSELVFVGYGVDAPEQKWNDYAGVDVKGKTVVMFVNDPGFHAKDESLFEGKRMTYYGRWTYKFEEAARKGAAAALIIHDTDGASYGWDVVKNSWSGAQFDLRAADDPEPRLPAQGWITGDVAQAACSPTPAWTSTRCTRPPTSAASRPVPLKAKLSLDLKSTISREVVAQRGRRAAGQPSARTRRSSTWRTGTTSASTTGESDRRQHLQRRDRQRHRRGRHPRDRRGVRASSSRRRSARCCSWR